jgi:hypothetical protein
MAFQEFTRDFYALCKFSVTNCNVIVNYSGSIGVDARPLINVVDNHWSTEAASSSIVQTFRDPNLPYVSALIAILAAMPRSVS